MPQVLRALSFDSLLRLPGQIPAVVGIPLVILGCVYLFFGKRLFRLLVAAVGAAVGFEAGRLLGLHFQVRPLWLELPGALIVGGVFWPLWQIAVFLVGGGFAALLGAQAMEAGTSDPQSFLIGAAAGFLLGGLASILLVKAMAVIITAAAGAVMVFVGGVALGHGIPLVRSLSHLPLVAAAVMGILMVAGIVAQMGQPDAEVANKRKIEEAEQRAKEKADAEARERYQRYRHGG